MSKYLIPMSKLDNLKKQLNRINKKCPGIIQYEELGETFTKCKTLKSVFNGKYTELVEGGYFSIRCMQVEISGQYKLADWQFVATLEHKDNGNIIRNISDIELPENFRTCKCYCEHCNTNRTRKDTFVVFNSKSNEYKQVGRQCLHDYTGLDASYVAALNSVKEYIIESEEYDLDFNEFNRNCGDGGISTELVLAISYYLVNKYGYEKADSSITTKQRIINELFGQTPEINGIYTYCENNKSIIDEIITYWNNKESNNEFTNNCKIAATSEYCTSRDFSFISYAVKMYIDESRTRATSTSEYVGNIGDRIDVEVSLATVRVLFTNYSYSYNRPNTITYSFRDMNGNEFIWSTATNLSLLERNHFSIRATVKEHKEYKGKKQTTITRGSITLLKNI